MAKSTMGWSLHEKIHQFLRRWAFNHRTVARRSRSQSLGGPRSIPHSTGIEEAMVNAITHGNKQAEDKLVESGVPC